MKILYRAVTDVGPKACSPPERRNPRGRGLGCHLSRQAVRALLDRAVVGEGHSKSSNTLSSLCKHSATRSSQLDAECPEPAVWEAPDSLLGLPKKEVMGRVKTPRVGKKASPGHQRWEQMTGHPSLGIISGQITTGPSAGGGRRPNKELGAPWGWQAPDTQPLLRP